jgi:hypothetical protein
LEKHSTSFNKINKFTHACLSWVINVKIDPPLNLNLNGNLKLNLKKIRKRKTIKHYLGRALTFGPFSFFPDTAWPRACLSAARWALLVSQRDARPIWLGHCGVGPVGRTVSPVNRAHDTSVAALSPTRGPASRSSSAPWRLLVLAFSVGVGCNHPPRSPRVRLRSSRQLRLYAPSAHIIHLQPRRLNPTKSKLLRIG